MKKTLKFIISYLALTCAVLFSVGTAFAETVEETYYPEIFTENVYDGIAELSDFAVTDEAFALADGNTITVIGGAEKTDYDAGSTVTALDSVQTEDGEIFIYTDAGGITRTLPDREPCDYTTTEFHTVDTEEYYYYYSGTDNSLQALNKTASEIKPLTGCQMLKRYGDKLYVIKENKLWRLDGVTATLIELGYTDYKSATQIVIGDTADRLKSMTGTTFVRLDTGAFKTGVDLNSLDGRYFKTTDTVQAKSGETALLMCYTGNAAIISVGTEKYITLKSSVEEIARTAETTPDFENATVCVPFDYIYSTPAMCEGNKLKLVEWGEHVKVIGMLPAAYSTELSGDFFKVSLEADGEEITGYIPCSFLTEYVFTDVTPAPVEDENFSNDDLTRTVTLIILVIALMLIALGYLTYVGTSGKSTKKSKKKKRTDTEE